MRATIDQTEIAALKVGTVLGLIMSIAGWLAYYLSNSEALLLDGNFSFVTAITTASAILIVQKRHKKTSLFPYGKYFYESFFVFFKGLLILGLTVAALFQNIIKIFDYFSGQPIVRLEPGIILYYSILMGFICFFLSYYYRKKNKIIADASTLLSVEAKSSKIDGYLSIVIGIVLILTTIVPENSSFSFLLYIGDAIIVILLSLFLLHIPLEIIRESFIELGGGILQDSKSKKKIENLLHKLKPENLTIEHTYVSKVGSSYLVVVYIISTKNNLDVEDIRSYRSKLQQNLRKDFTTIEVEVVLM